MKRELYPNYFPAEISRGTLSRKEIALTFDGGSGMSHTRAILEILASVEVTTTTFLTGAFIHQHPDDTKRLLESGHEVANHTMSHPRLSLTDTWKTNPAVSKESFARELNSADDLFFELTGSHFAKLWRAPFGARSREVLEWGRELGLTHVNWTHDTADWRTDPTDPLSKPGKEIVGTLLQHQSHTPHGLNGAIILLHLGANRSIDPLFPRLSDFCLRLRDEGFTFVKVSDLLRECSSDLSSGDLPLPTAASLPLKGGCEQIGYVEGFSEDSWIGPRFSAKLKFFHSGPMRLSFYVPDTLEGQELRILIDGREEAVITLVPGQITEVACAVLENSFTLDIHAKYFISPHLGDTGADTRYLSAILTGISSGDPL